MQFIGIGLVSVIICAHGMSTSSAEAQVTSGAAAHIAAAKAAAGSDYSATFDVLCNGQIPPGQPAGGAVPERARWYAAPVRVFDNLYFVGMTEGAMPLPIASRFASRSLSQGFWPACRQNSERRKLWTQS